MIKSAFRYLFLMVLSLVLAPTTVVFGGLPMRVVWRSFGRRAYWAGYIVMATSMALSGGLSAALVIAALAILIGVYAEVEDHGSTAFNSGFVAVLATLGASGLAVGAWMFQTHGNIVKEVRALIEPVTTQVAQINPSLHMTTDSIMQGMPSGLLVVLMMTLAVAAICEPAWVTLLKLRRANYLVRARLTQFQVPDVVVWFLMLAILGAFLQPPAQLEQWSGLGTWVKNGQAPLTYWSTNVLYVLATLYFFQGLAVVTQAFRVFRVAPFWQVLWYTMIVLQLFVLVSFIGLVDFWVDFRVRLARKPAESNKSFE